MKICKITDFMQHKIERDEVDEQTKKEGEVGRRMRMVHVRI